MNSAPHRTTSRPAASLRPESLKFHDRIGSEVGKYFVAERQRFKDDWLDYSIAFVVLLVSMIMIFFPMACRLCGCS
jgi:hypothetical protein